MHANLYGVRANRSRSEDPAKTLLIRTIAAYISSTCEMVGCVQLPTKRLRLQNPINAINNSGLPRLSLPTCLPSLSVRTFGWKNWLVHAILQKKSYIYRESFVCVYICMEKEPFCALKITNSALKRYITKLVSLHRVQNWYSFAENLHAQ